MKPSFYQSLQERFDEYFFGPAPLAVSALIRIVYSSLMLINLFFWMPDLDLWFSSAGVSSYEVATALIKQETISIFAFIPNDPWIVRGCYAIFVLQTLALLLGYYTRVQAICVFIWLASFISLNPLIWDGEDTVFCMLGFFLIFLPAGEVCSLDAQKTSQSKTTGSTSVPTIWALRLIQLEMCLIYFSTALSKASGTTWIDGTALYYVARLDDTFGRFPLPNIFIEWMPAIKIATWTVLFVEFLLPVLLLIPRTRLYGLFLGIALHLSIEYAMDLFLFQWVMICGLLSFLEEDCARKLLRETV